MTEQILSRLENVIGINFKNKQLLEEAITHKSYAIEKNKNFWNERMEFLGDSVLSSVMADYLYNKYPGLKEGSLSRFKSQFVSRASLTKWARDLNLGEFILLSHGEESTGGRERESILGNALESLLGAIYLEKGYPTAKKFIISHFAKKKHILEVDHKSKLQEIIQAKYKILPVYKVMDEVGPEHDKYFEVEVSLKKKVLGKGKGKSKKEAEQQAAREALENFNDIRE